MTVLHIWYPAEQRGRLDRAFDAVGGEIGIALHEIDPAAATDLPTEGGPGEGDPCAVLHDRLEEALSAWADGGPATAAALAEAVSAWAARTGRALDLAARLPRARLLPEAALDLDSDRLRGVLAAGLGLPIEAGGDAAGGAGPEQAALPRIALLAAAARALSPEVAGLQEALAETTVPLPGGGAPGFPALLETAALDLRETLARRERELREIGPRLERLQRESGQREARLAVLEEDARRNAEGARRLRERLDAEGLEVDRLRTEVARLEPEAEVASGLARDLEQRLSGEAEQRTELAATLADREAEIAALREQLDDRGLKIDRLQTEFETLSGLVGDLEQRLSGEVERRTELAVILADREAEIAALHRSTSWRITGPMRAVVLALRRAR